MTARRSDSLIAAQLAISSMVRPQPTHSPVLLSSRQILMHGVSKGGLARLMVPETYVGAAAAPSNRVLEGDLLCCLLLHPSPRAIGAYWIAGSSPAMTR